jgi:hypothetical protein
VAHIRGAKKPTGATPEGFLMRLPARHCSEAQPEGAYTIDPDDQIKEAAG